MSSATKTALLFLSDGGWQFFECIVSKVTLGTDKIGVGVQNLGAKIWLIIVGKIFSSVLLKLGKVKGGKVFLKSKWGRGKQFKIWWKQIENLISSIILSSCLLSLRISFYYYFCWASVELFKPCKQISLKVE